MDLDLQYLFDRHPDFLALMLEEVAQWQWYGLLFTSRLLRSQEEHTAWMDAEDEWFSQQREENPFGCLVCTATVKQILYLNQQE